jgi:hypothetical protein
MIAIAKVKYCKAKKDDDYCRRISGGKMDALVKKYMAKRDVNLRWTFRRRKPFTHPSVLAANQQATCAIQDNLMPSNSWQNYIPEILIL